jgi:hypothetical protein
VMVSALELATNLDATVEATGVVRVSLPSPEGELATLICVHEAHAPKVKLMVSRMIGEAKPKLEAWAEVAISHRAIREAAEALVARLQHIRDGDEEDVDSEQAGV